MLEICVCALLVYGAWRIVKFVRWYRKTPMVGVVENGEENAS